MWNGFGMEIEVVPGLPGLDGQRFQLRLTSDVRWGPR